MSAELLATELTRYAAGKIRQNRTQIVRCVGLLSDEQLWSRANERTNSVANLVLHLTGNVRQWILGGLAGEPIVRERPAEFAARGGVPRAQLVRTLEETVHAALDIVMRRHASQLIARYSIQGYDVTGVEAVCHVLEHFSWHTGQIVHLTKAWTGEDLSLYDPSGQKLAGPGFPP
jgi:uncharacterized damage-inducible protein DinB